jgi:predicted O-methyltransferase YrrM
MINYPNWFEIQAQEIFTHQLKDLVGKDINALQIGAYTGDATKWLFENVLTSAGSHLTDVDTWQGSDEQVHKTFDWRDVETVYDEKVVVWADRLRKRKMTSDQFFREAIESYDFIYIDGDHTAYGTLKDGLNAYDILNVGGILAFDDYLWGDSNTPSLTPKVAIDAISIALKDRLVPVFVGYQVWFLKVA